MAKGDENAFNRIFSRYRNQLYVYLLKITKSKETAEEIVLDTFLKIWIRRDIAGDIDNFEAFLFRIAHNQALDILRAAQRSPLIQQEIRDLMLIGTSGRADDSLHYKDADTAIRTAIQQLSPQRQIVFRLSREQDLTYDQIAAKLQLSRHTVRNHLSASLQFIRTFLRHDVDLLIALLVLLGRLIS
jgi:RNA polymerase sigma-70 factor (family 1)